MRGSVIQEERCRNGARQTTESVGPRMRPVTSFRLRCPIFLSLIATISSPAYAWMYVLEYICEVVKNCCVYLVCVCVCVYVSVCVCVCVCV